MGAGFRQARLDDSVSLSGALAEHVIIRGGKWFSIDRPAIDYLGHGVV
jgi:hypothetical protein